MFAVNMPLHVMLADGKGGSELYPGTVTSAGDVITAEISVPTKIPSPAVGAGMLVYFDVRGKFFQQNSSVVGFDRIAPEGDVTAIVLPLGNPVSAEKRNIFRVSVATSDLRATVEREKNCQVVDISSEGFAIIARGPYRPGTLVRVELPFGDQKVSGQARIQTARMLSLTQTRFGFFVPPGRLDMRKALQRLSAEAQRTQLQRLARTA